MILWLSCANTGVKFIHCPQDDKYCAQERQMVFCPTCGKLLQVASQKPSIKIFLPFVSYVEIRRKQDLVRKKIKPDFSKEHTRWEKWPSNTVTCPHCGDRNATYHQSRTRSANEPMTAFPGAWKEMVERFDLLMPQSETVRVF
ncbi:DNA-directed RNA polymerase III subunit RPC10-like [Rhodamnia argentea]|uniref:DNA-directed RNA polymerase III subunit RPC10-like n=1 Tax=Rhodamnia argentea TaxID=178133 RepID=A0A8B8Q8S7_9MYRT|nr:DNA-directed RNA polymerase III subunit RPC10-like [Rhodamnia argentea]